MICNWLHLNNTKLDLTAHYALNNSLNSTTDHYVGIGDDFEPIGYVFGNAYSIFSGNFDGRGYTISDLVINKTVEGDRYIGLFAYTTGNISNINLNNISVTGSGSRVGGLVGYQNDGTISNSYASGKVTGYDWYVGGLVGYQNDGTISNSYASGNVSGNYGVGGLAGYQGSGGTISNSYASGKVTGYVLYVGGLVGFASGTISNNYASGNVSGSDSVGGLVGYYHSGTISNSYSMSNVTRSSGSDTRFGGFVGYNYQGKIFNSYSTGAVIYEGETNPTDKGFAGGVDIDGDYEMSGNFWDVDSSGQTSTSGIAEGKTTAEMKDILTFSNLGWDIEYTEVYINNGYPFLGWQNDNETTWLIYDDEKLFCGGEGTIGDPYLICTPEQLDNIRLNLSAHYKLNNNIDLNVAPYNTGEGWWPIGNDTDRFTGIFDGDSYDISNLYINRPSTDYVGLFGYTGSLVETTEIHNVNLVNVNVTGNNHVGGLVGYLTYTEIHNSSVKGSIYGDGSHGGGLAGYNMGGGEIHNSYFIGDIYAGANTGGLVGYAGNLRIYNSYAIADISGFNAMGGLVGWQHFGEIHNSYTLGIINGSGTLGGLAGRGVIVNNSYSASIVIGTESHVGGLIGQSGGSVTNSFYDREISGQNDEGKGIPKTTAEMKNISTYLNENWDIEYTQVNLNDGYPFLSWEIGNSPTWLIYEALIVTLTYPEDEEILRNNVTTLNFTVNKESNCTLYSNISGSWEGGEILTNVNGNQAFTTNPLSEGEFLWNVLCINSNDETEISWAESNRTFTISLIPPNVEVDLIAPEDGEWLTVNTFDVKFEVNIESNCSLYTNLTGIWVINQTMNNVEGNNNFTLSEVNEGTFIWNVLCIDSTNATNFNMSDSNWTIHVDTEPPYFTFVPNNQSIIYGQVWNGVQFTAVDDGIGFREYVINDTDNFKINETTGWLEWNEQLKVGNYYIEVNASDRLYNVNSIVYNLNITQATPVLNYYLNGLTQNLVIMYPETLNASANVNVGEIEIYRNGTDVTDENNIDMKLKAGFYRYDFNVTGNENYTSVSETLYVTVNKNDSPCDLFFTEESPVTYPETFIVYTNCDPGTDGFIIYRNGTEVGNNSLQELSAGTYNFTLVRGDADNYENNSDEQIFVVNKGEGIVHAYLNNLRSNITVNPGDVQLNATLVSGTGVISVYNNTNLLVTDYPPLENSIPFGVGVYNFTVVYEGNENYTGSYETWWLTVTDEDIIPVVELIEPEHEGTVTTRSYDFKFNVTALNEITICKLIVNETVVNSLENVQRNVEQEMNYDALENGDYEWYVNCTDILGKEVSSNERNFTVNIHVPTGRRTSRTAPTFNYEWDCETGLLEIETESNIQVRLMSLIDYSTYSEEAGWEGKVSFVLERDGPYRIFTSSTGSYYALQFDERFDYCEVEEFVEPEPEREPEEVVIEEEEEVEEEVDTTELEQLIKQVEEEIQRGINEFRNVDEAQNLLRRAKMEFNNENYDLAEQLTREALFSALNAESYRPEIPVEEIEAEVVETPEELVEETEEEGIDLISILIRIVILGVIGFIVYKFYFIKN